MKLCFNFKMLPTKIICFDFRLLWMESIFHCWKTITIWIIDSGSKDAIWWEKYKYSTGFPKLYYLLAKMIVGTNKYSYNSQTSSFSFDYTIRIIHWRENKLLYNKWNGSAIFILFDMHKLIYHQILIRLCIQFQFAIQPIHYAHYKFKFLHTLSLIQQSKLTSRISNRKPFWLLSLWYFWYFWHFWLFFDFKLDWIHLISFKSSNFLKQCLIATKSWNF